jgi:hypothetical protein
MEEAMNAVETNEIAVFPADNGIANSCEGFAQGILRKVNEEGYYSTFDVSTTAGRKALYRATNASSLLRDFMETPLELKDITFAPCEISNDDGDTVAMLGVYLTDTDGNTYSSTSTGVLKSAMRIISQLGEPSTWDEPLSVVCKETNTAKGRRYKFLDVE